MKERPILFNAEMVQAILSGRKTQTRRVVKPQRNTPNWSVKPAENPQYERHTHDWWLPTGTKPYSALPSCPFGKVGDQLWVRETWQGPLFDYEQMEECLKDSSNFEKPEYCEYAADGGPAPEYYDADDRLRHGWRPSIHMPRWASRINLLITGVRVERLNSMTNSSAKAEGYPADREIDGGSTDPWLWFRELWDSLYPDNTFKVNPWVWVIEFKLINNSGVQK